MMKHTPLEVHLVDGTYELFRQFYAPGGAGRDERTGLGAVRGVIATVVRMLADGVTHVGVATDHIVESFRNKLWPGYKTGAGMDPALWAQFHPLEAALRSLGVAVWPMVEFEADDALAAAAARAARHSTVDRVLIWTPDKDLAQCVVDQRVVQVDRRSGQVRDAAGVRQRFGVAPPSIPDYLALVGDSADGFPGLPGWGAKSTATVVARFRHLEEIPPDPADWQVSVRGASSLAATLAEQRDRALLFRRLATLRLDAPVFSDLEELRWTGPAADFPDTARDLGDRTLPDRVARITTSPPNPPR